MKQYIKLMRDPSFGLQMAGQAAGQVVNAGIGLALQRNQDKRTKRMAEKMQRMQMEGSKEMTDYNMKKQLEMWQATGYGAQMKQMKEAGLNPAMMYGMSGGGGQTASVATGNAPTSGVPSSGGEIQAMMGMGLQRQMMEAQVELIKAQANKTNAEIPKVGAETDLVKQNIKNAESQQKYTEAMTAWQELETRFAGESYETRQKQINQQLEQTTLTVKQIGLQNRFTEETWKAAVDQIEKNVVQTQLHNELLEVQKRAGEKGIQLTEGQIQKLSADIAQGWEKLRLEGLQGQRETVKLAQTDMDLLLKEMQTKFNVTHPGLWNVAGGAMEKTMREAIENIKEKLKRIVPKL